MFCIVQRVSFHTYGSYVRFLFSTVRSMLRYCLCSFCIGMIFNGFMVVRSWRGATIHPTFIARTVVSTEGVGGVGQTFRIFRLWDLVVVNIIGLRWFVRRWRSCVTMIRSTINRKKYGTLETPSVRLEWEIYHILFTAGASPSWRRASLLLISSLLCWQVAQGAQHKTTQQSEHSCPLSMPYLLRMCWRLK